MCPQALRNIGKCDCQESVTTRQTDAGQSDSYVPHEIVAAFPGMHVSPASHS